MTRFILTVVGLAVVLAVMAPLAAQAQKGHTKKKRPHSKLVPADTIRNHLPTDTVGIVNGEIITYRDFNSIMAGYLRIFTQRSHNDVVTDSLYSVIVDSAWDRAVSDILTEEEIGKRRIAMTDAEIKDSLIEHPPEFLRRQFSDSTGEFHPSYMSQAMNDPRNDSIVHIIIESEKVRLETERLMQSIAPHAATASERERAFEAWLKRAKLTAHIIDNRLRFGFY